MANSEKHPATWIAVAACFIIALAARPHASAHPAQSSPATNSIVVLKGALLIDGTGRLPIANSVVVIDGGKIRAAGAAGAVSIPKNADVHDLAGKTIMPALVNLHGHLGLSNNGADSTNGHYTEENVHAQLDKYLAYGVATVASFGEDADLIYKLRAEQHAGTLGGARLFTAGRGFAEVVAQPNPTDIRFRPKTADEARADLRELAAHHPDYIKMWVDDGLGHHAKMQPEVYQAIIDEAHKNGIRVFAHAFYLADAKALVAAGLNGFAHSIRDQPVDSELIQTMKSRHVFLIPTLIRDEVLFAYADGAPWLDDLFFKAGHQS